MFKKSPVECWHQALKAAQLADKSDYELIRKAFEKSVASVWPEIEVADQLAHGVA